MPEFLFHQFRVGQRLVQRASTNSMKGMVSKSALAAVTIAVPPISDQKRFVEFVSRAKFVQQTAMRSLQELDALFKSLQHRAFRAGL